MQEIDPSLISRWGTFAHPDAEAAYRDDQAVAENALARLCIVAGSVGVLAFLPSDWQFLGNTELFWALVTLRVGLVFSSVALWVALQSPMSRRRFDTNFGVWSFIVAAASAFIPWTRPVDFTGHIIPNVLTVLYCFTLSPMGIRYQVAAALVLIVSGVAICFRTEFEHGAAIWATVMSYLSALFVGIFISLQQKYRKRELFAAFRNQESLRQKLEDALAQIRTLRGMHCICCECKKMRDEDGRWLHFEVYVRDRTHAQFSHGLCPECYEVAMNKAR